MASSKDILCRYFLSGVCQNGSNCKFSHDRATGRVDNICKFYLKGSCTYGKGCRYFHDRSRLTSKPTTSQPVMKVLEKPTQLATTLPKIPPKKAWSDEGKPAQKMIVKEPRPLCPFAFQSTCRIEKCQYIHGEECPICRMPRLHPTDGAQRQHHLEECEKEARKVEQYENSKGRVCSICLEEIVVEGMASRKRVFGILSNCPHIYCLVCIRNWRRQAEFEDGVRRSCPQCRVHSHFVIPSQVWISSQEDKEKLVKDYKAHLSKIPCQFFQQGSGNCPFFDSCFYNHQDANGQRPHYRHLINQDGEYETADSRIYLSDFLQHRDDQELEGQYEFLYEWSNGFELED
ncbi:MKRN1 [Cordylochernes scorpioides]|uniref:RING-type E3 ubiquitin transferase n=1 Tax=Cordylochernes scorpioides TaxID=51811 RepID=A0ABY6LTK4_9ARAC|nr:MKRN1 [Cordylochernes scorpioides]